MPRSRMLSRKLAIAASSAIMVVVAACGGDGESALPTATQANAGGIPAKLTTVTVSDNKFAPLNLQIPAGANVTWNWTGYLKGVLAESGERVRVGQPLAWLQANDGSHPPAVA